MSTADGNDGTQPGRRGARGWSAHPPSAPADIDDLPEPLMPPAVSHVAEVHRDVRQLRNEQHAMRNAVWNVQHDVTRVDAAVTGLRTVVDEALRKQRRQQQIQLWVSILATAMITATFLLILLRSYRLVGV